MLHSTSRLALWHHFCLSRVAFLIELLFTRCSLFPGRIMACAIWLQAWKRGQEDVEGLHPVLRGGLHCGGGAAPLGRA